MAFDCLLLCKAPGRSQALAQYLFQVIRHDYSLTVRRHVARAFSESILMTLAVGEVYMAAPPGGIIEVTDNIEQREKEKDQEQAKIVKAVRKEFNSKPELRQELLSALIDAFTGTDREILFALIKAAEVMSFTVPEPKPGAIIKLQTPLTETPTVSTPKIRLSMTPSDPRGPAPAGEPSDGYGFPRMPPTDAPSPGANPIKLVLSNPVAPSKDKKKKKKNVPKAQSGGLSDQDFKTITVVLTKIQRDSRSLYFRLPVDPLRDGAPDYTSIVKRPMDLMSAGAKFEGGAYATRQEFEDDIRLIISNCYLYNPVGSGVRKAGEAFEAMFNRIWSKTENTLRTSNAGPEEPPPPKASKTQTPATPSFGESSLMPPPPLPGGSSSGGGMKIKLKQSKSVTIDTGDVPMPPPPLPKKSAAPPSPAKGKEKAEKAEKPAKKNKPAQSMVDDLLGAELDLLEGTAPASSSSKASSSKAASSSKSREKSRERSSHDDGLDDLLAGTSPPPAKKIKLNSKQRATNSGSSSSGPSPMAGSPAFVPRDQSPAFVPRGQSPAFVPRDKSEKAKPGLKVKVPEGSKLNPAVNSPKIKLGGESSKPKASDNSAKIKIGGESKGKYAEGSSSVSKNKNRESERERERQPSADRERERDWDRGSSKLRSSGESSKSRTVGESYKPRSSDGSKPRSSDSSSSKAPKPSAEFREMLKRPEKEKKAKAEKPRERTMSPARPPGVPIFSPPPPIDALLSAPVPAQPMVARTTAAPAHTPPVPAPVTTPLAYAPIPVSWPQPPNDLPTTRGNTMPFRQKRAKVLVQVLIKDPNAIYVSLSRNTKGRVLTALSSCDQLIPSATGARRTMTRSSIHPITRA